MRVTNSTNFCLHLYGYLFGLQYRLANRARNTLCVRMCCTNRTKMTYVLHNQQKHTIDLIDLKMHLSIGHMFVVWFQWHTSEAAGRAHHRRRTWTEARWVAGCRCGGTRVPSARRHCRRWPRRLPSSCQSAKRVSRRPAKQQQERAEVERRTWPFAARIGARPTKQQGELTWDTKYTVRIYEIVTLTLHLSLIQRKSERRCYKNMNCFISNE